MRGKPIWLSITLACFLSHVMAQNFSADYKPIRDFHLSKEVLKKVNNGYDSIYKELEYSGRKTRLGTKDAIKECKKYVMQLDTAEKLMYNDSITNYVQGIVNKIQQKNASVGSRRFTVFTYRTEEPNASNMSNGLIFFNLDLLSKLDNESEIAYILAHEMSHDILGHVMNSVQLRYEIINSAEFKKEVKQIKGQEYNRFKAIEALLTKFLAKYTLSGRAQELAADSLGLILFYNAGYSPYVAIQTEEKLDSVDHKNPLMNKIDYEKMFGSSSVPFDKGWLQYETDETITGRNLATYEEFPDSLKTHPDCKLRVAALKRIIANAHYDMRKPVKSSKTPDYFKMKSYFEMLEYCQQENDFGEALDINLQLLSLYPNNNYLKCSLVNCLYELSHSKEDHYFSQVCDFPAKYNCASYNQCLIYLHNVNSSVLKEQMMVYYKANVEGKINTPYAAYLATLIKGDGMAKKDRPKLVKEYQSSINDPYYLKLLKDKYKIK